MTEQTANRIANVVLAAAALGAAFVIVRTPPLRRMAGGLLLAALTGTAPAWLNRQVREAWDASGRTRALRSAAEGSALS
jgi:hypothetical protein